MLTRIKCTRSSTKEISFFPLDSAGEELEESLCELAWPNYFPFDVLAFLTLYQFTWKMIFIRGKFINQKLRWGRYIGGGPFTNLKCGEKDMALMLSQHWGWHTHDRNSREANTIWMVTVTLQNLLALEGCLCSLPPSPLPPPTCRPLFFLVLLNVFCFK